MIQRLMPLSWALGVSLLLHAGVLLSLRFSAVSVSKAVPSMQIALESPPAVRKPVLAGAGSPARARSALAPQLAALPSAGLRVAPAAAPGRLPAAAPSPAPAALGAADPAHSFSSPSGDATAAAHAGSDSHARYLGEKPAYPEESRQRGEQGRVVLRLVVGADGRVRDVAILQSSGFPLLDQAAVSQLRHGAFSPAMRAGQPVDSVFNLGVPFSLRSKQ